MLEGQGEAECAEPKERMFANLHEGFKREHRRITL